MEQVDTRTHQGTQACADYLSDGADRLRLFVSALELAEENDRLPAAVADEFDGDPDPQTTFRNWYDRQIAETLLTRGADGFLTYLAELLGLVYEANPNALPPEANIPVSLALELPDRGALIRELAGRRVRRLSRKGIDALNKPFAVLGFPLYRSDGERDAIGRVIAQRDLIVHSRGVVDRAYRRRVPSCRTPLGEPLALTRSGAVEDSLMLMEAASRVDQAAITRWGFDTVAISMNSYGSG